MKRLVEPPAHRAVFDEAARADPALALRLLDVEQTDGRGRYLAWDQLRHRSPPEGLSVEQWWAGTRIARRRASVELPLTVDGGRRLRFCLHGGMAERLHWADKHVAGDMAGLPQLATDDTRKTYLIGSLTTEAINSSQLEGASTTTPVARKMIASGRRPSDRDEQMIFNNYRAMEFIQEIKRDELTMSMVLELHRILTADTLERKDQTGRFRRPEEVVEVVDNRTNDILHTPPPAVELDRRMRELLEFANGRVEGPFVHPVIRAMAIHFMIGYVHPFVDGNGRTARALFYWHMAGNDYWLSQYVSISGVLKRAPARYVEAYLRTETDEGDLTFFIDHQLAVLSRAIDDLRAKLSESTDRHRRARTLIENSERLGHRLNARQQMLLLHALDHPGERYGVQEHRRRHGVTYETARKDLLFLSDELGWLEKTRRGRAFAFFVPADLSERLENAG